MPLPQATQPQSPHGDCPSSRLRIDLTGGRVQLAGRLDRTTVHLLHDAISTLLLTDGVAWVIDATDVTAFDGMGVRAIGAAYRRASPGRSSASTLASGRPGRR